MSEDGVVRRSPREVALSRARARALAALDELRREVASASAPAAVPRLVARERVVGTALCGLAESLHGVPA
jgi:hypothetical protein